MGQSWRDYGAKKVDSAVTALMMAFGTQNPMMQQMAAERIANEGLSLVGRGRIAENTMSTRISDAIANFFGVNEYRGETGEIQQNRVAEYQTLKEQLGYMRGFDSGYERGYAEAQFAQFVAEEVVTTVATLGAGAILSSARITATVGRAGVQGMRLGGKILGRSAYRSMLQSGVGRTLTKTGYGGIRGLALTRTSRAANLLSRDMFSAGRLNGLDGRVVTKSGAGLTDDAARVFTSRTKFKNIDVLQRGDINWSFVDDAGRTNLQRAQRGLSPIGADGHPINLHHIGQQPGKVAEVLQSIHQKYSKALHHRFKDSLIDRKLFSQWKRDYWKYRVKDLE